MRFFLHLLSLCTLFSAMNANAVEFTLNFKNKSFDAWRKAPYVGDGPDLFMPAAYPPFTGLNTTPRTMSWGKDQWISTNITQPYAQFNITSVSGASSCRIKSYYWEIQASWVYGGGFTASGHGNGAGRVEVPDMNSGSARVYSISSLLKDIVIDCATINTSPDKVKINLSGYMQVYQGSSLIEYRIDNFSGTPEETLQPQPQMPALTFEPPSMNVTIPMNSNTSAGFTTLKMGGIDPNIHYSSGVLTWTQPDPKICPIELRDPLSPNPDSTRINIKEFMGAFNQVFHIYKAKGAPAAPAPCKTAITVTYTPN